MTATALRQSEELSLDMTSTLSPKSLALIERVGQDKVFRHGFDVYLKDSNATGNIYFARYFEWQGICREKWFFECVAPDMLQSLGVFVTKEARQNYIHETFAFQRIECEVNTFAVKQCSFSLLFRFFVEGQLVSVGTQQIVFADFKKKIQKLPAEVIAKVRLYQADAEKLKSLP